MIGRPASFAQVVERLETLTLPEIESDPRGMSGNAARCALELAILDAYGRRFGESVGRAVELAKVEGLRRFPSPRAGSLQRGHHGRVAARRANLGLEDADLRLPPGEDQGRHQGTG